MRISHYTQYRQYILHSTGESGSHGMEELCGAGQEGKILELELELDEDYYDQYKRHIANFK
jgi:hypothetical protein